MTGQALLTMWMRPDLTCLPESRDHMKPSLQPEQLCFNTPNVQHIRQVVYGVRQFCASQKHRVQLTGVGKRLAKTGKSSGQPTPPLQRVVNSLQNVAASLVAVAGANATGLGLHAQLCVAANVRCNHNVRCNYNVANDASDTSE